MDCCYVVLLKFILIVLIAKNIFSFEISNLTEYKLKEVACFDLNDTENCGKNFQKLSETNATNLNINLMCRSNTFLSFTWSQIENYNLKYVVELKEYNSTWNYYETIEKNLTLIDNLNENTFYRIRIWRINKNGFVDGPYSSKSIKTYDANDVPRDVKDVKIKDMILNDNNYFDVTLTWTPGEDRSCTYEVLWMNGFDYDSVYANATFGLFETIIGPLEFGNDYVMFVMAKSDLEGGNESNKTQINVKIPNCLEVLNNLNDCIPEPPSDLQAIIYKKRKNLYNVKVSWLKPNLIPDYYLLELDNHPNLQDYNLTQLNVSGDVTIAEFIDVELDKEYEILAFAFSMAGQSHPAIIKNYVEVNEINIVELWIIISGILLFIICFSIVLFFLKLTKCTKITTTVKQLQQSHQDVNVLKNLTIKKDFDKWETDLSKLSIGMVLGKGAFGVVRRGWLQKVDGTFEDVAVKTLNDNSTEEDKNQFLSEIEIMKSVGIHRHLVSLMGCNTTSYLPVLIVEYCSEGDLKTYLQNAWNLLAEMNSNEIVHEEYENLSKNVSNKLYDLQNKNIPKPVDLLSFARQISIGMEYLSSLHVLHRDLAARNILICDDGIVKVSDFGLSRDVYRDNVYYKSSNGKLPIRWMAIESLTHQIYTSQSDVWSYGILLWEIVTLGANPYPGIATQELLKLLESGYRMEKPNGCSDVLYDLMWKCWQKNPKERPTFTDLMKKLDAIMESSSFYIKA